MAADRDLWLLRLDRAQDRLAPEVLAAAEVDLAARWRVQDAEGVLGRGGETGGALGGKIEAPVPWRDRDPGAEAVELDPVDRLRLSVQDGRRLPAIARFAQCLLGLVVAGDQQCRPLDPAQRVDRLIESAVDRGEVAGADDDVGSGAALDEVGAAIEVAMDVAEREHQHRADASAGLTQKGIILSSLSPPVKLLAAIALTALLVL